MRIVKRQEMMQLPPGTLFCEVLQPWVFGQLCIKGETFQYLGKNQDFWERCLDSIDADDTGQMCDRLDEMAADSAVSYPLLEAEGRNAHYDDDRMYLVYEPSDVEILIRRLKGESE